MLYMGPYFRTCYDISRLRNGRDGHVDQSEAYSISSICREFGPCHGDLLAMKRCVLVVIGTDIKRVVPRENAMY